MVLPTLQWKWGESKISRCTFSEDFLPITQQACDTWPVVTMTCLLQITVIISRCTLFIDFQSKRQWKLWKLVWNSFIVIWANAKLKAIKSTRHFNHHSSFTALYIVSCSAIGGKSKESVHLLIPRKQILFLFISYKF